MAPKGISLHIGVGKIDNDHYGGIFPALPGCEFDAKDMQNIASENNFSTNILITPEETKREVIKKKIIDIAGDLEKDDIFLLTYAGHGSQVAKLGEVDKKDEKMNQTWVLHDSHLIDDELSSLWPRFKDDVRIVVISDSCHSGTMAKAIDPKDDIPLGTVSRSISFLKSDKAFKKNKHYYKEIYDALPNPPEKITASILLISACQDNQLAKEFEEDDDKKPGGVFTHYLKKLWDNGGFVGNYKEFHKKISIPESYKQKPNWFLHPDSLSSNEFYSHEKPFFISDFF